MLQKIILIGNVGADPTVRANQAQKSAVANFSLATNRRWNDRATGQLMEETTWFRCAAWNTNGGQQLATLVANSVIKGSKVYVEAHLTPDPDTGGPRIFERNDGSVGAAYEVTVDSMRLLDPAPAGGGYVEVTDDGALDAMMGDQPVAVAAAPAQPARVRRGQPARQPARTARGRAVARTRQAQQPAAVASNGWVDVMPDQDVPF